MNKTNNYLNINLLLIAMKVKSVAKKKIIPFNLKYFIYGTFYFKNRNDFVFFILQ